MKHRVILVLTGLFAMAACVDRKTKSLDGAVPADAPISEAAVPAIPVDGPTGDIRAPLEGAGLDGAQAGVDGIRPVDAVLADLPAEITTPDVPADTAIPSPDVPLDLVTDIVVSPPDGPTDSAPSDTRDAASDQGADATSICTGACCADSDCLGICQTCSASRTCVAVINADDPNGRCAGTCDATGTCKSKRGQACQAVAAGCASGTTCSPDGVCCDQDCTSPCMACDILGFLGTCTPVASGNPHGNRPSCSGTDPTCAGSCSGRSDGQCSYPSKPCGAAATCSDTDKYVPQSMCVSGACQAATVQTCAGGFVCSANACKTSCTTSADCQADYFCSGGLCHSDVVGVEPGGQHTCAWLKDGRVVCWGHQDCVGDSVAHSAPVASPVQVVNLTNVRTIRSAQHATCALTLTGSVWCWGHGESGQLGNGTTTQTARSPVAVVSSDGTTLTGITSIYAGNYAFCAINGSSTSTTPTYCWGDNSWGKLGFSATGSDYVTSARLLQSTAAYTQFAMGDAFQVGVTGGTTVYTWGYNFSGAVVPNTSTDYYPDIWSQSFTATSTVVQVVAGWARVCMRLASGAVQCWGDGSAGGLGTGGTDVDLIPGHTISGLTATNLSGGYNFGCAQTAADTRNVLCWGNGSHGIVGPETSVNYPSPTTVNLNLASGLTVTEVVSSTLSLHVCAIISDGSLMCWGSNSSLKLGTGSTGAYGLPAFVQANW